MAAIGSNSLSIVIFAHIWQYADALCNFPIKGGSPIGATDAPFVASYKAENNDYTCSGAIVHEQFVVTVAHVIVNYVTPVEEKKITFSVTVGGTTNDNGDEILVKHIFVHPKFDAPTYDYDLAVIQLDGKLEFNNIVKAIPMATSVGDYTLTGKTLDVYGFALQSRYDRNPSLTKLNLQYKDNINVCKRDYRKLENEFTERMFCAHPLKRACAGDHGGPVVYNNKLVGLASWGSAACDYGLPNVFTNIGPLRVHILSVIQNHKV